MLRYRELLKEWEGRGWRIDADAAEARAAREALVIPSPGRRSNPKGWVLDTVPLVPARSAGKAAGTDSPRSELGVA